MSEQTFYIPIVNKDTLCCIICDVDPDEVDNSIAKSFFHWQTLKCRLIVNLMQDFVIGSPVPDTDRSFYIITTKEFHQDAALTNILERLNLTTSAPLEVTPRIYITCIKYTFQFVLAPSWNRVSTQLYIKDRHFLSNIEANAAIKMNLNLVKNSNLGDNEISMKLSPFNVILYPSKLRNLGLPQSIIVDFVNNPVGIINVTHFKIVRVSVLPSMRKGRLLSIHKKIPETCPFKNWTDLRRHWKNMYGYRLPESDEGIIFYELYFPIVGSNSSNHFIYPDICVKEELNQFSYKNDPAALIKNFINDLVGIMPMMCSYPLQINEKSFENYAKNGPVQKLLTTPVTQLSKDKDLDHSDRLSLPNDLNNKLNEPHRQQTTPMSPTPCLLGKRINTTNNFDFENWKKIKKIHESKPVTINQSTFEKSQQNSLTKTCKASCTDSMVSTVFKVPEKRTLMNIFSASATSTRDTNSQNKTSKSMIFTKAKIANLENIPKLP